MAAVDDVILNVSGAALGTLVGVALQQAPDIPDGDAATTAAPSANA